MPVSGVGCVPLQGGGGRRRDGRPSARAQPGARGAGERRRRGGCACPTAAGRVTDRSEQRT
ncbi:hypothetical protein C1J00_19975 [Streptomyces cahuitamycinicus]|uniref:Uncharacterized protein n=1 Tax=Streptomyces cahuitamycinicus TaxID=2070367 RepID=A0A2N8TN93_9ACTN|nr:hypothetical protein C1J00_19975 [Streptomyces cahuitamycinicus]